MYSPLIRAGSAPYRLEDFYAGSIGLHEENLEPERKKEATKGGTAKLKLDIQ